MMRTDAKVEKVYLYPKPVDFRNPSTAWLSWSNWTLKSRCLIILLAVTVGPGRIAQARGH